MFTNASVDRPALSQSVGVSFPWPTVSALKVIQTGVRMKTSTNSLSADVVILGGGLGGVAAALRLCAQSYTVVIVEPTRWLGGQATSQGVSALDEHRYIETFGGSPDYLNWRRMIRQRMATLYGITPPELATFNPGNAWVSNLCFFPHVANQCITEMLLPYIDSGMCRVLTNAQLISVQREKSSINEVTIRQYGSTCTVCGAFYIDATELGDVLYHANLTYSIGFESSDATGEELAPQTARPNEVQGFTYCFAVSFNPGESHRIAKPEGYDQLRDQQPFTLTLTSDAGDARPFSVFIDGPTGLPPFWTYRRLWDGNQTNPPTRDIAMINWNSNDYHHGSIIDVSDDVVSSRLDEAKRLSLAFLFWMQTEMPRDDGGFGYPELKLECDIMGSDDGLSMFPYIRESRRTIGMKRIVAHDLLVTHQPYARAKRYDDSVGIGWYFMDLHPAPGNPKSMFAPTRPFQIPLGALLPPDCSNLVMGNKNIATTHLSNGSYRLHPVEWNIGAVAGELCAYAMANTLNLHHIWHQDAKLRVFQKHLLRHNHPIAWCVDVPFGHPCSAVTQYLITRGILQGSPWRAYQLEVCCDQPLADAEWYQLQRILLEEEVELRDMVRESSWNDVCCQLHASLFGLDM
ncbi:MAG: FAD-dependent oxidoreductase [Chloroflexi bacterium]|nr:FAD-dependent oxidoreductase [Chloroflexota bacterium]